MKSQAPQTGSDEQVMRCNDCPVLNRWTRRKSWIAEEKQPVPIASQCTFLWPGNVDCDYFQNHSDVMPCPAKSQGGNKGELMTYAFPSVNSAEPLVSGTKSIPSQGMTLKDWFAGQIIAAMLGSDASNSSQRDKNGQLCKMDQAKLANLANSAYQAAEALLLVRAGHEQ